MYLIFIIFFGKTSEFQNVFTELFLTVEDLYVQWLCVFLHLDFNSFQCKKQSLLMNQSFHTTPLQILYNEKCMMTGECPFFLVEQKLNILELCTEAPFNIIDLFLYILLRM